MGNRLADAAAERLSNAERDEAEMGVTDVMRVLARIAKTGKPGDRLRAAELIGRQLGMFREKEGEPGRSFADLVLAAQRRSPPALGSQVTEGDAEGG